MSARSELVRRAKRLAAKFYAEAQEIFDDANMTDAIYDGEVMQALVAAQGYAEDVENAS